MSKVPISTRNKDADMISRIYEDAEKSYLQITKIKAFAGGEDEKEQKASTCAFLKQPFSKGLECSPPQLDFLGLNFTTVRTNPLPKLQL
jgi:hypothetical protein